MPKDARLYGKFTLNFPRHPKIAILSDAAFRCLVEATLWSLEYHTKGVIPDVASAVWSSDALAELCTNDDESPSMQRTAAGWVLLDIAQHPVHRTWLNQRPRILKWIRDAVMDRDGRRCVFCGATTALSLDHIIRYRHGGPDTVENLRVLCMPCNLERG